MSSGARGAASPARRLDRALLAIALAVAGLAMAVSRLPAAEGLSARLFDRVAHHAWPAGAERPVVVAIDRASLAAHGAWPWSRDRLATLLTAVAAANPRAVGLAILLDGPDTRSPAARARLLGAETGRAGIARLAEGLPDGDAALAAVLRGRPVALGLALDPIPGPPPAGLAPILAAGELGAEGLWRAPGAVAPPAPLAMAAAGVGVLALPADGDGITRHAPLLALAGGRLVPGLALETVRLGSGGAPLLVEGPARRLRFAGGAVPLGPEGLLRLLPPPAIETVSAADLLAGREGVAARLTGRVVLVGATAAETGALRPGPGGAAVADVLLQAGAAAQIAAGLAPLRPAGAASVEAGAMLLAALGAALAARRLGPGAGGLAVVGGAALWTAGSLAAGAWLLAILDPVGPSAAGLASFAAATLAVRATREAEARRLGRAFEQRLAPAVLRRLAETPGVLRLAGERREITRIFTDLEGFSGLAERAEPEDVIALLDGYFSRLSAVATAHGGMVEKIVGDALHLVFNAPLDLPDHPARALACAEALVAAAEAHRTGPGARALGLGRTRVGIETGLAVVGDVGGGARLDYTAHGRAVNAAARLEPLNKVVGTSVLAGPGLAARLPEGALMPVGEVALRGICPRLQVWTPWPEGVAPADRARVAAALAPDGPPEMRAARLAALGLSDGTLARVGDWLARGGPAGG